MALTLRKRLEAGEVLFTGWSTIPDPITIHYLASTSVDAVTLDMQHGANDERSVLTGIPMVAAQEKPSIVRIPVARWDMVSRALDFGADAIIAPMINSVEDAKALADHAKYPPMGGRSWGPTQGVSIHKAPAGQAYLEQANDLTMTFAMIETREALEILDDILAVDGIDAVFVGPADFSIAWTKGKQVKPTLEDMMPAIEDIAKRAKAAGKYCGIFAMDPKAAPSFVKMGFQLIALGFETHYLSAGADHFINAAKSGMGDLDGGY